MTDEQKTDVVRMAKIEDLMDSCVNGVVPRPVSRDQLEPIRRQMIEDGATISTLCERLEKLEDGFRQLLELESAVRMEWGQFTRLEDYAPHVQLSAILVSHAKLMLEMPDALSGSVHGVATVVATACDELREQNKSLQAQIDSSTQERERLRALAEAALAEDKDS